MIVHIVEHSPKGTIYNLIKPLEKYGQKVIYTPEDVKSINDFLLYPRDTIFILHTTGRALDCFNHYELLCSDYSCALFLHVSLSYMKYQGREKSINRILYLHKIGVNILVPCEYIKNELFKLKIKSYVIQLGIEDIKLTTSSNMECYCNKILTCCSEFNNKYMIAKGIYEYEKFIISEGLQNDALIVGSTLSVSIPSRRFNHNEFMYILSKAKMYIQFSKYESYNITAIEAKRLKIPVVLLNSEGVENNIVNGFLCENYCEMCKTASHILNNGNDKIILQTIENNYTDSTKRENVAVFANDVLKWSGTV